MESNNTQNNRAEESARTSDYVSTSRPPVDMSPLNRRPRNPLPPRNPGAPLQPQRPASYAAGTKIPKQPKTAQQTRSSIASGQTYKARTIRDPKKSAAAKKKAKRRRIAVISVAAVSVALIITAVSIAVSRGISQVKREQEMKLHPLPFRDIVQRYSDKYDVPEEVIYAVMKVESNFDPNAVSRAGAIGLMQMIPETFEWLQTKTGEELETDMLYSPEISVKYGAFYLGWLHERFSSWRTVWAAYNAGIGRVYNWLEDERYSHDGELIDIPIAETANYVERVQAELEEYTRLYFAPDAIYQPEEYDELTGE